MGEKDSCEKLLEDYADVFADIINVLVFHGERLLKEEHIVPGPTASIYKDETRGLRPQIRDVMKFDKKEQSVFSVIGLENQSTADPDMVFRVMGYDYASYRSQMDSDDKKRYPVFSVVLYFGMKPWSAPRNLYEALNVKSDLPYQKYLPELIANLKLNVIEVAYLPKEVREQFTSDFRIVVDYFSSVREGREEEFIGDTRTFRHVEEMLEFFRIFSGDQRYQEIERPILEMVEKGELISMCTLMDTAINKGWREGEIYGERNGEIKGEIRGKLKAYYSLVGEGVLTIQQAAEKMGLTTAEFSVKIEELER